MRPVFLHSEWRTGSTYVWAKLGRAPGSAGFCEPFNEVLATIDRSAIERIGWDSWPSGHGRLDAPYFQEYADLVLPAGGIAGFEPRFAIEDYFDLSPDAVRPQVDYVQGLIDLALAQGRRPVLGFCRSLGRLPWIRAAFPGALHIELRRDPVSQWLSGWEQWAAHGNPYFLSCYAALVGLAGHPYLKSVREDLHVPLPPDRQPEALIAFFNDWVLQSRPDELFRLFWHVHALNRLRSRGLCELVMDADGLSDSAPYRESLEEQLRHEGFDVSFGDFCMPRRRPPADLGDLTGQAVKVEAHLAAWQRECDGTSVDD